jgi:ATP-binding cassette subfamily B protein
MTADTAQIEQVVGTTISVALRNALMAIGGLGYLLYLAPALTALLVLVVPLVLVPIVWFGRRLRKVSRDSQDRVAGVGSLVSEVLGAMKIVQGFNQEGREFSRLSEAVEATFGTARRRILIRSVMTAIVIAFIFGAITALLWRGAVQVAEGTLSGGTIAAFVLTGVMVAGALGSLTEVYGDLLRGAGAASRLNELLSERPQIAPPARPVALPEPPRGGLAVPERHLPLPDAARRTRSPRFQPDRRAGRDRRHRRPVGRRASRRSSSSPSGSTTRRSARSGSTGCRSPRPTRPTCAGAWRWCRRKARCSPASARDNLRYGNWDASEEAIWEAARAANAEDFLRTLPQGLDTFLGEGGARLSGGPAAARGDRPRAAARRADPAARRGDQRARRRKRAAGAAGARAADAGAHHAGHRPPPGDRARGRPDRGDGPRADRRGRHPRDAQRRGRALRAARRAAVSTTRRRVNAGFGGG